VNFLQPFSAAWKTAEQINFHQKGNCGIKTGSRLGYDTVIKGKHEAKQEQKSLWKKLLGKVTLKQLLWKKSLGKVAKQKSRNKNK